LGRLSKSAASHSSSVSGNEDKKQDKKKKDTNQNIWDDSFISTSVHIELFDTAGDFEGFATLRPLHYRETDIFILTFDTSSRESFLSVTTKWIGEVKNYSSTVKKILVGTKTDLEERRVIRKEEAEEVAKKIDAIAYLEVSAKQQQNLHLLLWTCLDATFVSPEEEI
jgi:GTPase SAR1 family protein